MKPRDFIIPFILFVLLEGCASSSEQKTSKSGDSGEALRKQEKSFNPADYDPNLPSEKPVEKKETTKPEEPTTAPSTETDLVSGFRVQVTFTENIEQANNIKTAVSSLLIDQPVYMVFESPYYKVRVGDFLSKPEANLTQRSLIEKGYKDAWIVPDKVHKPPE